VDIRAAGYDVVINLAMPDSTGAIPNEAELVAEQELAYAHIPVVWDDPMEEDLVEFFEAMDRYQGHRIFVHCALNWRVSSFVFLHQVIVRGIPQEIAHQALYDVWQPNPVWERFIARILDKHRVPI
jgi:protein tyrosine phosphatase (PTP) superfamily phosphohydrolase (DUF442 family)